MHISNTDTGEQTDPGRKHAASFLEGLACMLPRLILSPSIRPFPALQYPIVPRSRIYLELWLLLPSLQQLPQLFR